MSRNIFVADTFFAKIKQQQMTSWCEMNFEQKNLLPIEISMQADQSFISLMEISRSGGTIYC